MTMSFVQQICKSTKQWSQEPRKQVFWSENFQLTWCPMKRLSCHWANSVHESIDITKGKSNTTAPLTYISLLLRKCFYYLHIDDFAWLMFSLIKTEFSLRLLSTCRHSNQTKSNRASSPNQLISNSLQIIWKLHRYSASCCLSISSPSRNHM